MKKSDLVRHLKKNGCSLFRQGKHEIWKKDGTDKISAVPRHMEIKRNTAKRICQDLGIPVAPGL